MSNWKPIETAPKDGTKIDLWLVDGERGPYRAPDAFWDREEQDWRLGTFTAGQYVHVPRPTHWMLPPEPPQ